MSGKPLLLCSAPATVGLFGATFQVLPEQWMWKSAGQGTCPVHPESCFFSDTYLASRALFRDMAHHAGAEVHTLTLALPLSKTSDVGNLTMDIAVSCGSGRVWEQCVD